MATALATYAYWQAYMGALAGIHGRIGQLKHSLVALNFKLNPRFYAAHAAQHMTFFCLLRGCVALEYGLVSFGLRCFLRLAHALYCRSRRCLASVAFSV